VPPVTDHFRLVPAGDAAIVVEFEARIDPMINARAIRLAHAVQSAAIAGVRDVVPTYRAVAVYFDPIRTDYRRLVEWLEREAGRPGITTVEERPPISVPVCYGSELGPDLESVADSANMPSDDVVAIHASATYRVFMLGFAPGFAYMGLLDPRIAAPRHSTPRVRVPAGSVAIAGRQTGVLPIATPSGWQVIGRTPLKPFDVSRSQPFLFEPGDAVRFIPMPRADYERAMQSD
jgi:inhibitor of KinA